jgi:GTP cyclohydrolase I
VQIKGGDNDSLIIGTINVQEVIDQRANERKNMEDDVQDILAMNGEERKKKRDELKATPEMKIAKVSARTFF